MTSMMKGENTEKEEETVRQGHGRERGRDRIPKKNEGKNMKREG